ncbi:MAG: DUF1080 domain-containing protein, partial [Candidatus Omnitrophica bacterium]|nr:DUF1080 domain-containing protein [Candidatus Omnitrophota bacterium]
MNAKTIDKKHIIKNRSLTLVITFCLILSLCSIVSAGEKKIATTGPLLLQEICSENNMSSNIKDIEKSAKTDKGATSFSGLKKAAEKKGFVVQGLKTDVGKLKELTQKGCVLVVLSKNRTYVRVKDASEWTVTLHNPSRYPKSSSMPISVFKKQWDGKALFIQTKKQANEAPLNGIILAASAEEGSTVEPLSGGREEAALVALSGAEMEAQAGGAPCANPPCDTDGLPPGSDGKTGDPVIIGNGDLCSEETDFLIETRGLIPLEISRTYNAQVVSNIDGWVPDIAAGPWSVRDGVYNGYGDRVFTTHTWEDLTLTADIKTVKAGTEQWETAWLNFRYQDEANKYYFLIKKDGTLEFTKKQNGVATQQQKASSYNPLNWNTVKIIANGNNIKIYVNNNLEFNYTDPSPLYVNGPIAAEARFCYAQFDNVRIQSGTDDYFYDFNTPDREEPFGRGWSFNYGIHIQKFQNGDVRFVREDGRSLIFRVNPDGTYTPVTWVHDTLTKDGTGFTLHKKDGTIYRFNLDGVLQHLEDRFGNRITLTYETIYGALRLKYVIDPTSRQFTFEYWPDGRVKEIKDPTGIYKYQYIYNGIHLVQVIDPRGNSKHYEYDPVMNLRSAYIDREGNRYEYNYTYNARIETQKDPELNVTTFEYWWDTTHIVNKDNETWYYTFYPMCSGLWGIANNLGSEQTFYWDGDYNLTQLDEEYGKITKHEYDDKGNVTKIIDPENGATYPTILQYGPDYSLVTYTKDPKGNEVNYIYDNGKLTEIHEPLGKTTVMTYYPYGKIKTLTDAEGNLTEFEYDAWGYPKKIKRHTETLVIEKNFAHSIVGNLLSETDEEGKTRNYTYDENNSLKEIKDGSNNIFVSNTYDKNDKLKTITDSLNHTVIYKYDWAGNQTKVTEYDEFGIEYTTELTYDNKNYLHLA